MRLRVARAVHMLILMFTATATFMPVPCNLSSATAERFSGVVGSLT